MGSLSKLDDVFPCLKSYHQMISFLGHQTYQLNFLLISSCINVQRAEHLFPEKTLRSFVVRAVFIIGIPGLACENGQPACAQKVSFAHLCNVGVRKECVHVQLNVKWKAVAHPCMSIAVKDMCCSFSLSFEVPRCNCLHAYLGTYIRHINSTHSL